MTIIDSLIGWIPKEREVMEGEVSRQTSTSLCNTLNIIIDSME